MTIDTLPRPACSFCEDPAAYDLSDDGQPALHACRNHLIEAIEWVEL